MKIYLWKRLAWSQARFAEQPPCFLLAATLQGQIFCWPPAGRGSSCWGAPVPRGETCPSSAPASSRQPSQPHRCSQAPSAAFLTAPRMRTLSLWLSAGGARAPGHRLCCSGTRSRRGLSKLGGQLLYRAARTSQTGCLREQVLSAGELSISCQLVKPFSGQSCQQAGRAARGGCGEARPWCSVLWATCPCTAGIEWARRHGNRAGMASHQP